MIEDEIEVKVIKVHKEPRISLTMISRYVIGTEKGKARILKDSKYPSEYIPRYHEMARKLVCEIFSGNLTSQYEIYFEKFKDEAARYRKEAKDYPDNKDPHKNRIHSAKGLEGIVAMSHLIIPVLEKYVFRNNLSQRRDAIMMNTVRVGAVADMLLYDQIDTQIGFLKINFSTSKIPKEEAAAKLFILNTFFENRGKNLHHKNCIVIDVPSRRIFNLSETDDAKLKVNKATSEIRDGWDLI